MKKILTNRIQRIYKPIDWSLEFIVKGGTTHQQNDVDHNLFYPDREITPSLIEPHFRIIDKDKKTSILSNDSLINITWKEVCNKVTTSCVTPDYEVFTDGTDDVLKGSIIVNKNIPYLDVVSLLFEAEYYDVKRKRTLTLKGNVALTTSATANLLLYTKLDVPNCVICDPFEMDANNNLLEVITPSFILGEDKITDKTITKGWWYSVKNGVETLVNPDEDLLFESLVDDILTVRKDFVSDVLLRYKSALFPDGNLPDIPPANCNVNDVRLIRKYPEGIDFEMVLPEIISDNITSIPAKVVVTKSDGVISNPDKYYAFIWKIKGTGAGATFTEAAQGSNVTLPAVAEANDIQLEIYERGAMAALTDDDGKYLVDDDNNILVAQLKGNEQ